MVSQDCNFQELDQVQGLKQLTNSDCLFLQQKFRFETFCPFG